jgi:hypothetical protein
MVNGQFGLEPWPSGKQRRSGKKAAKEEEEQYSSEDEEVQAEEERGPMAVHGGGRARRQVACLSWGSQERLGQGGLVWSGRVTS